MASEVSGSKSLGQDDLEVVMKELGLKEEDLDDVVFEQEASPLAEATRRMAISRVHTDHEYNKFWFYKNMFTTWYLA